MQLRRGSEDQAGVTFTVDGTKVLDDEPFAMCSLGGMYRLSVGVACASANRDSEVRYDDVAVWAR